MNTLNFYVPNSEEFKYKAQYADRINKTDIWSYHVSDIIKLLSRNNIDILWVGNDMKTISKVRDSYQSVQRQKQSAPKHDLINLYVVFTITNNKAVLGISLFNNHCRKIGEEIVTEGAIKANDLAKDLGIKTQKHSRSYYSFTEQTSELTKALKNSPKLVSLYLLTYSVMSNIPSSDYYSWYNRCEYLVPTHGLIYQILKNSKIKYINDPSTLNKPDLKAFNGGDLLPTLNVMQQLIQSKTITPATSKVGLQAAKKFASMVKLADFPNFMKTPTEMGRSAIVCNLAFFAMGYEVGQRTFKPKAVKDDADFMRELFGLTTLRNLSVYSLLIPNSIKYDLPLLHYSKQQFLALLHKTILSTLSDMHKENGSAWAEYDSFVNVVNCNYAYNGGVYIYPTSEYERPENVRHTTGIAVSLTEYKKLFHDPVIKGTIMLLAAIGAVEIMVDVNGEIACLRLTKPGEWLLGITDTLEFSNNEFNVEDYLDINPATAMILVKNPDYPLLPILSEVAEKVSDNRYHITPKSLASKCYSATALNAKISKLKTYIIAKPTGKIDEAIKTAKSRCNLVKLNKDAAFYTLLDIDPNNTELHNLILSNQEIRENSMRVEGCRLFVKSSFINRFYEIINAAGFIA